MLTFIAFDIGSRACGLLPGAFYRVKVDYHQESDYYHSSMNARVILERFNDVVFPKLRVQHPHRAFFVDLATHHCMLTGESNAFGKR